MKWQNDLFLSLEQVTCKSCSVGFVWVEKDGDFSSLHQGEHVRENGGVHGETRRVRGVSHHTEHVLEDVGEVSLVEALGSFRTSTTADVLQKLKCQTGQV